jgi:hypothetical protein
VNSFFIKKIPSYKQSTIFKEVRFIFQLRIFASPVCFIWHESAVKFAACRLSTAKLTLNPCLHQKSRPPKNRFCYLCLMMRNFKMQISQAGNGQINIEPLSKPRKDWEQAFKEMAERGDR